MKIIMFILSLLILICMGVMLCGAIIKDTATLGTILISMMCVLSLAFVKIAYCEMKQARQ